MRLSPWWRTCANAPLPPSPLPLNTTIPARLSHWHHAHIPAPPSHGHAGTTTPPPSLTPCRPASYSPPSTFTFYRTGETIKAKQTADVQERVKYVELDATSPSWPVDDQVYDVVLMSYISGSVHQRPPPNHPPTTTNHARLRWPGGGRGRPLTPSHRPNHHAAAAG